jgi:hypothetical protein
MKKTDLDHSATALADTPATPVARTSQPGEYLTRRQASDYIREQLGRPMSFSTASKLAATGEFAEPAIWWGRRPLYSRNHLRAWTEARSRPTKASVVSGSPAQYERSTPSPAAHRIKQGAS